MIPHLHLLSNPYLHKIYSMFILVLLVFSFLSFFSMGGEMSMETINNKEIAIENIQKPEWGEGDHWKHTFDSEGSNMQLDKIKQDGWVELSVMGEDHIRIDGEWINVYNVSINGESDMWGHTERWGFNWDYELDVNQEGNLYYDVETLTLVSGEYTHEMTGHVERSLGDDIPLDITMDVELENEEIVHEEDYEGFYSFPITDSESWNSETAIEKYSYTRTDYGDSSILPDSEWIEEEYTLSHSFALESNTIGSGIEGFKIAGEDSWERKGRYREMDSDDEDWGEWKDIDESGTGTVEDEFGSAGNSDYMLREDFFHDTFDYHMDDATFELDDYDHNPYELDIDVDDTVPQTDPGGEVEHEVMVKNVGTVEDTMGWELLDDQHIESVEGPEDISLSPDENETISIGLAFSEDAEVDKIYEHEINIYSENDASVNGNGYLKTEIQSSYGIEVQVEDDNLYTSPGGEVIYNFTLNHVGTVEDTIGWELLDDQHIESVEGPEDISLSPDEDETISIGLTFSEDAEVDKTYEHEIRFYSENDASVDQTRSLKTEILSRYGLEVDVSQENRQARAGGTVTYQFTVENLGTGEDTIDWKLLDDEYIKSTEGPDKIEVIERESKTIEIELIFSEEVESDTTYEHEIEFMSINDGSVSDTVTIKTDIVDESQPIIDKYEPAEGDLELLPTEEIEFNVVIDDPSDGDISWSVRWYVDDEEQIQVERQSFTLKHSDLEKSEVDVMVELVKNEDERLDEVTWDVDVKDITIADKTPEREEVDIYPYDEINFGVEIDDESSGEDVFVRWYVDYEKRSKGKSFTLEHSEFKSGEVNGSVNVYAKLIRDDKVLETVDWNMIINQNLFALESKEYDLEEGPIDSDLREGFEDEGYKIREDAELFEENGIWFLSEGSERKYMIEVDEEEINIYESYIISKAPEKDAVEIYPDHEERFSVEVNNDSIYGNVSVEWYVDGEEWAEGVSLTLEHSDLEDVEGENFDLRVESSVDALETITEKNWTISWIDPDIPYILDDEVYPPSSTVNIVIGRSEDFSVQVGNSEDRDTTVKWYVNGEEKAEGKSFTLETEGLDIGRHDVKAELIDEENGEAIEEKSWTVEVREEPTFDWFFYLKIVAPIAAVGVGGGLYYKKKKKKKEDDVDVEEKREDLEKKLETFKEHDDMIDTSGIERALEQDDLKTAENLLNTLNGRCKKYNQTLKRLEELDQQIRDGKIEREAFDETKENIVKERSALKEHLEELEKEIMGQDN